MKSIALLPLFCLISINVIAQLKYPDAKRENFVDVHHGVNVYDPYRWLENIDSEQTRYFVQQQNEILNLTVNEHPLYRHIENNISEMTAHERYNFRNSFVLPAMKNGSFFFNKIAAGENKNGLYIRTGLEGEDTLILGPDFEHPELELTGFHINENASLVAYGVGSAGNKWVNLRIADLDSPAELIDELYGFYLGTRVVWHPSNRGFYYVCYSIEEYEKSNKLGLPKVYYHAIGTDQSEDQLLYEKESGSTGLGLSLTTDSKYVLIEANNQLLIKSASQVNDPFVPFLDDYKDYDLDYIANDGDTFFFETDKDAPNTKVISIEKNAQANNWKTVIPESELPLGSVVYNSGKFVARYTKDIINTLKVFDLSGNVVHEVEMPFLGSSYTFSTMEEGANGIFYSLTNLFNAQSILSLNLNTGKSEYFLRPEQTYDPDEFVMEQIFYESTDGTKIPALLSYKKGLKKDGNNPTMVYGYGALGISAVTFFRADIVEWLKLGGIYINAGIRGGGEYGNEWQDAGRKLNKSTGIDDYIAAGDWLVEQEYTNPSKLVMAGGSLSGLLPAVAITRRPDFYAAAVIRVPVLDFVRFAEYDNSRSWQREFGDPKIEEEFQALFDYSPYHKIKENTRYPAVFIQCGEKDTIAPPLHAYKFAAAMQHAQSGDRPIFLKTSIGAGHFLGGVTLQEQNETKAQIITFLAKELSLKMY